MNLSSKNWFARYYQWIYGNLPKDVCSFFWGSLLAIGLFPILSIGRLFNSNWDYDFSKVLGAGVLFWFLYGLSLVLGIPTYAHYVLGFDKFDFSEHYHPLGLSWYGLLLGMPLVTVGMLMGIVLLAAIPISIIWLTLKLFKVTISASQRTALVQNTSDFVGAIKRNHCTKINWK